MKKPSKQTRLTAVAIAGLLFAGGAFAASEDDIVALKNALYGAGYSITNTSGTMDQATKDALRAFQRDQSGLQVTGELDDATKEALGMAAVKAAASPAPAAAPASDAGGSGAVAEDPADEEGVVEEDEEGGWSFF